MIAVSTLDVFTAAEIDCERSTEKRGLDMVRDNSSASEDRLDIATTKQVCYVTARSRMDDRRPEHEKNLAVMGARLFHLACDLMDRQYLNFFSRDRTLHKSKRLAVPGTLERLHANTLVPNYHFIANAHLVHWFAISSIMVLVNHNSDIHLDIFNLHPLAIQAYLGG